MKKTLLVACLFALGPAPSATLAGESYSFPGDAPYSVPRDKMDAALDCKYKGKTGGVGILDGSGVEQPVLLVHGTGITRRQSWGWNYWTALPKRGFEVCWVQLPAVALKDIQTSAEYVARAYQTMHAASDQKIDVLGHSQGGLQPRWAIKWFPAGRFVADYIGLASPNHGTQVANGATKQGNCFPSCWQLRQDSKFENALNRDEETPGGIHYTSIWTTFDELIQPPGTQNLEGAVNVSLQDLCPGRPVDHAAILGDFVAWKLVRNALKNPGPADPDIVTEADCTKDRMPGAGEQPDLGGLADFSQGKSTDHEPPLKPYAKP
ncbi:MAG: lipase [Actinomycetota bacterium]|nr:lipase [Actinomycetota bacterium]